MRLRLVACVMAAVAVSLAVGASAGLSDGGSGGQPSIAFVSDRGGQQQLWAMGVDGTSPRRVSADPVSAAAVSWTADGRRLVVLGDYSSDRILTVGGEGSSPVVLSPAFSAQAPVGVSPDGSAVAFLTSRSGCYGSDPGCQLVLARTDGSARRVLTEHSSGAVGWSPDGRSIAFEVRAAGATSEIWKAAADGSGATRLVGDLDGVPSLAWLADGRLVLVVGWYIAPRVFLYRPGDPAPTRLTGAIGDTSWVERSPDGKRFLVQTSTMSSPGSITVYDLSSTVVGRAFNGILSAPTWAPDSQSLVYGYCDYSLGQRPPGPCDVQRLDLRSGLVTKVLPGPASQPSGLGYGWYGGASFAPDGSRLAVSLPDPSSGKRRIVVVKPDGSDARAITAGTADDSLPAWQPRVPPTPPPPPVRELAPNPGFESDPAGSWRSVHQDGGVASFAWTTVAVHSGSHALSITSSGSSTSFSRWITSGRVPVQPRQAYRFAAWLKASGIAGSGRIDMTFFDRDGVYIAGSAVSSVQTGQTVTGTQGWTKLSFKGTAPAKADSVRLEIRLYGTGTLYADDVSLTVG